MAARNLGYLKRAFSETGLSNDEHIEHVQTQTLADQGLPDNEFNRALLVGATFLPIKAYYAVLHAELRFVECHNRPGGAFHDTALQSAMDAHSDLITVLGDFRNGFVHPRDRSDRDEHDFLQGRPNPGLVKLQNQLDQAIERLRVRLRTQMMEVLDRMPEMLALFCRAEAISRCRGDPLAVQDSVYAASLWVEMETIDFRFSTARDQDKNWVPSSHQENVVRKVGELLAETMPFTPSGDWPDYQPILPPMKEEFVLVLIHGNNRQRPKLRGRTARNVASTIDHYLQLVITAATLMNECFHLTRRTELTMPPEFSIKAIRKLRETVSPWNRIQAYRLSVMWAAILVPVLLAYSDVREDNPAVSIARLDGVIDDGERLSLLRALRNEMLHVNEPGTATEISTRGMLDGNLLGIDLLSGIAEFLSWFASSRPKRSSP